MNEKISAVAWCAHKEGVTYGEFAARLKKGGENACVKRWKADEHERKAAVGCSVVRGAAQMVLR